MVHPSLKKHSYRVSFIDKAAQLRPNCAALSMKETRRQICCSGRESCHHQAMSPRWINSPFWSRAIIMK
eukprot:scaffold574674_cov15-Prasinocladus_malaysianus.AAC.1